MLTQCGKDVKNREIFVDKRQKTDYNIHVNAIEMALKTSVAGVFGGRDLNV